MAHRYVPEWMEARSEAAHKGWETRWERMWELGEFDKLGEKGREYVQAHHGAEVMGGGFPEDYYDDYESPYDIEIEY